MGSSNRARSPGTVAGWEGDGYDEIVMTLYLVVCAFIPIFSCLVIITSYRRIRLDFVKKIS